MNPDDFKQAWKEQTRLTSDTELLLKEVRRNEHNFQAMIFWRDAREVGVSLLMIPFWIFLGARISAPWTWYLMLPVLLWVAGYMLVIRIRQRRHALEPDSPLRRRVEASLAQVEDQISLLRNVLWWALVPLALAMLAFFGQGAWEQRGGGWWTALAVSTVVALAMSVLAAVYWLNRYAIRSELEPRRRELETLLRSLDDEAPDVTGS